MKRLLLLPCVFISFWVKGQFAKDSADIIKLLQKEAATWRSGEVKAHADCWQIRPYTRMLVSTSGGKTFDVPPEQINNPATNGMGKGGYAIASNYKMSITGNSAWVSHNEISTAADSTKSYSYEIRMLEKIKGQWKLVGQSIHLYKPE